MIRRFRAWMRANERANAEMSRRKKRRERGEMLWLWDM